MKLGSIGRWIESAPLWRICGALFVLSLASRITLLALLRVHPEIQFAEMEKIALSLATTNVFGNPYKVPTGPSAHHAPMYPILLSLIFRVLGTGTTAAIAMVGMNVAFAAAQYALVPVFCQAARLPRLAGAMAGFIGALIPFRILREIRWETTLSAALLVVAATVTMRWWNSPGDGALRGRRPGGAVLLGLVWGTVFYGFAACLPPVLLMLLFFCVESVKIRRANWVRDAALVAGAMVLTVLPWTIRNRVQLGGWMFIRSNFGLEIAQANNDYASPLARDNITAEDNFFAKGHPWSNEGQARQVLEKGEVQYNRDQQREALEWIKTHPAHFASLTWQRFFNFWVMPSYGQRYKDVLLFPIFLLSIWGFWRVATSGLAVRWFFLAMFIAYPVVYYLVESDSRYRYPIDWCFYLLASLAVMNWRGAARTEADRASSVQASAVR